MSKYLEYARIIVPEKAGGYSCSIMEFSGCYSQGETLQEAWDNIESAADCWTEACRNRGRPIPLPFDSSLGIGCHIPKKEEDETKRITLPQKDGVSIVTGTGDLNLNTMAVEASDNELWTLVDSTTGAMRYDGIVPVSVKYQGTVAASSEEVEYVEDKSPGFHELKSVCWSCGERTRITVQTGYIPGVDSCDLSKLNCVCMNKDCPVQGKVQPFSWPITDLEGIFYIRNVFWGKKPEEEDE